MFTCTTRFKIEDEQLAFIQSLSIHDEGESDEISEETEDFEPISDTEEGEEDEIDEVDDSDLVSLPVMPESQIRASSRVKKRPRVLDDYETI